MKKLPIGKSDFKSIIEDEDYYIDKTDFIKEIIDNSAKVILLPRPRRFGKTLNLSMLRYFFDIEEDNRHLFDNLNISNDDRIMSECNKYPIIYITFKDIKENTFSITLTKIYSLIRSEFGKYEKIIESIIDEVSKEDRENYYSIINREASQDLYENGFKLLSKLLTIAYKQKCIILIDG